MTNDQMTNDGNLAFSAFDVRSPRRSEAKAGARDRNLARCAGDWDQSPLPAHVLRV